MRVRPQAAVNALDISNDGEFYVSCSADRSVKVWHYDEGVCWYTGEGHSSAVHKVKISPDESRVVSIGGTTAGALSRGAGPDRPARAHRVPRRQ